MATFPDLFAEIDSRLPARRLDDARVDEPQGRPAPWGDTPHHQSVAPPLTIDLVEDVSDDDFPGWDPVDADAIEEQLEQDGKVWNRRARPPESVDAIAQYIPWHIDQEGWGIYVAQHPLNAFAVAIADELGVATSEVRALVLRQVFAHEYVHFSFEVAASEIEDVLRERRYERYFYGRFARANRWSPGPLEEVVATWAELRFARGRTSRKLGPKPAGFADAVAAVNRRGPPGYRDFERMADPRDAERIVADVASLIADREIWSSRWWPHTTESERNQVPKYWIGDPAALPAFGAFKALPRPSMRDFIAWLSHIDAKFVRYTRHGRMVELPNGRRTTFKDTTRELLDPEAKAFAQRLGISKRELFEHVAEMTVPASLESV